MKCPKCGSEMKTVMRFEEGKSFAFNECKNCYTKTHNKRIHFEEINNENSSNPKRI